MCVGGPVPGTGSGSASPSGATPTVTSGWPPSTRSRSAVGRSGSFDTLTSLGGSTRFGWPPAYESRDARHVGGACLLDHGLQSARSARRSFGDTHFSPFRQIRRAVLSGRRGLAGLRTSSRPISSSRRWCGATGRPRSIGTPPRPTRRSAVHLRGRGPSARYAAADRGGRRELPDLVRRQQRPAGAGAVGSHNTLDLSLGGEMVRNLTAARRAPDSPRASGTPICRSR